VVFSLLVGVVSHGAKILSGLKSGRQSAVFCRQTRQTKSGIG
jgi:hypothetical protein